MATPSPRAREANTAVRVHHRVRWRAVDAQDPAGRAPRIPCAGRTVHADLLDRVLPDPDRRTQLGDLAALRHLVLARFGGVLRLQPQAVQVERAGIVLIRPGQSAHYVESTDAQRRLAVDSLGSP